MHGVHKMHNRMREEIVATAYYTMGYGDTAAAEEILGAYAYSGW